MNTAQKPNGPKGPDGLTVSPTAYQRTHGLADAAMVKANAAFNSTERFGTFLTEACTRIEDLEKDNQDLWRRLDEATVRKSIVEDAAVKLKHAQVATTIAVICCAVCFGMMVLAFLLAGLK